MAKKTPAKKNQNEDLDLEENQEDQDSEDSDKEMNDRINSIVTSRLKRWGDQFASRLEQTIAKQLASVAAPKTEESDETEVDAAPVKKSKPDPKLSKLERELAETRRALEEEKTAKAKSDEAKARSEERSALEAALTDAGVTDKTLRGAALALLTSEGRIVRDEDGRIRWKGQDKYGSDTLQDPSLAAKAWAKSDGKAFMPAVNAGGSGSGPASNGKIPKAEIDKMTARERAGEEIRRATLGLPPLGDD